ncbi:MAG: DUF4176 domain-containing protein [Oscillospiraceae bacterium]|nr:DUF4176 domain-containing protein [Oscillospiraceae bacterium]
MEKIEFHPLGSVVIVRGGVKKTMIIGRGLAAEVGDSPKIFDYAGCLYPEGLLGDQIMYFNHADIAKLVFTGFSDEDNELMINNINDWMEKAPYKRGNPLELNEQNMAAEKRKEESNEEGKDKEENEGGVEE